MMSTGHSRHLLSKEDCQVTRMPCNWRHTNLELTLHHASHWRYCGIESFWIFGKLYRMSKCRFRWIPEGPRKHIKPINFLKRTLGRTLRNSLKQNIEAGSHDNFSEKITKQENGSKLDLHWTYGQGLWISKVLRSLGNHCRRPKLSLRIQNQAKIPKTPPGQVYTKWFRQPQ